jgi:hypothetical protein
MDGRDLMNKTEIYYKRSSDEGTTWSPDTRISIFDSIDSAEPAVAVSGPFVHVAWHDTRNGSEEIYYNRSTDSGMTWGLDTRLSHGLNQSVQPSIASMGAAVHVVWTDCRDGNGEIYYNRSTDSGVTWGADVRLTTDSSGSAFPSIATTDSNVHIAWYDGRNGPGDQVYYKRSTDAGLTWSPDARLTNASTSAWSPSIAASGMNVHLAWSEGEDPAVDIRYKRSSDGGKTWTPDTSLNNDPYVSDHANICVSGSNIHIVWFDYRNPPWLNDEIYYIHSPNGGVSWGPETRLTYDENGQQFPSVTTSGPYVHVVWPDWRDPANGEIYYKRNPTGNLGVEENTFSSHIPHFPLSICPNPFTSFATVPNHEADRFALYDISGRRVGTYKGDKIGEDLGPGVYFIRPYNRDSKPLRIVKVK